MDDLFVGATKRAVEKLDVDFQKYPDRWWTERDIQCGLYYYLRQEDLFEKYNPIHLIRTEFPTLKKFDTARGYYDLAMLDPGAYYSKEVQRMKLNESWDKYLKEVKLMITVEIKLWQRRLMTVKAEERANQDIQKLTEPSNKVAYAFFLNFVQLQQYMQNDFAELQAYVARQKTQWPNLRILWVPGRDKVQSDPSKNWL